MEPVRIAVIGLSKSGKTKFISSLYKNKRLFSHYLASSKQSNYAVNFKFDSRVHDNEVILAIRSDVEMVAAARYGVPTYVREDTAYYVIDVYNPTISTVLDLSELSGVNQVTIIAAPTERMNKLLGNEFDITITEFSSRCTENVYSECAKNRYDICFYLCGSNLDSAKDKFDPIVFRYYAGSLIYVISSSTWSLVNKLKELEYISTNGTDSVFEHDPDNVSNYICTKRMYMYNDARFGAPIGADSLRYYVSKNLSNSYVLPKTSGADKVHQECYDIASSELLSMSLQCFQDYCTVLDELKQNIGNVAKDTSHRIERLAKYQFMTDDKEAYVPEVCQTVPSNIIDQLRAANVTDACDKLYGPRGGAFKMPSKTLLVLVDEMFRNEAYAIACEITECAAYRKALSDFIYHKVYDYLIHNLLCVSMYHYGTNDGIIREILYYILCNASWRCTSDSDAVVLGKFIEATLNYFYDAALIPAITSYINTAI